MRELAIAAADELALSELGISVVGLLGKGHFGSVLLGERSDGTAVAVKLALRLDREAATLKVMEGDAGFPSLLHYKKRGGGSRNELLVMERLGPSLQSLWEEIGPACFSAPTVLHIGRGALRCLKRLHFAGVVHNDIKPANLVLPANTGGSALGDGAAAAAVEVMLIDFGISTRAQDVIRCDDAPPTMRQPLEVCRVPAEPSATYDSDLKMYVAPIGTPDFASIKQHERSLTSAVDDVESLVYCLTYLAAGDLPWRDLPQPQQLQWKRELMTRGWDALCDGWDGEAAERLLRGSDVSEALRRVWAEVMASQASDAEADPKAVDHDACVAALWRAQPQREQE